jgi:transposase InsO family protein
MVHEWSRGTYGSPRVHVELAALGQTTSVNRIARLMQADGIGVRPRRGFRATTPRRPPQTPPPVAGSNSPTFRWRDGVRLSAGRVLGNTRGRFLQSPALAIEFEQVAVVHQPVQQWGHDHRVAQ